MKAECDITCTSSNATQVVEHIGEKWGVDTVIMVPDEFLARNVAANTDVKIIAWKGHCEVHQKFSGEDVRQIRDAHPGAIVLARIPRVVFGTDDPKAGACGSVLDVTGEARLNHRPQLQGGLLADECGQLLRDFFAARR